MAGRNWGQADVTSVNHGLSLEPSREVSGINVFSTVNGGTFLCCGSPGGSRGPWAWKTKTPQENQDATLSVGGVHPPLSQEAPSELCACPQGSPEPGLLVLLVSPVSVLPESCTHTTAYLAGLVEALLPGLSDPFLPLEAQLAAASVPRLPLCFASSLTSSWTR